MRKRCAQAVLLLAATVVFLLPAITSQGFIEEISNDAFEKPQRPAAVFMHDEHNAAAQLEDKCWFCHHVDGKAPSEDETSEGTPCADCHKLAPDDGTTSLMDAFHKQCIDCHADKGQGPLACGECHVRK